MSQAGPAARRWREAPTLASIAEAMEAVHPGRLGEALRGYAAARDLPPPDPDSPLLDRGTCLSGALWRRPGPEGTVEEHVFLVIPEAGDEVAEKRHFRLLPNPDDPADPRLLAGEEQVAVLTGVLAILGADVRAVTRLPAGAVSCSYACRVDPAAGTIGWFQDRHALRAEMPFTGVVFRQRLTTLSRLADVLGAGHPDLAEVRARGVSASPSGVPRPSSP